MFLLRPRWLGSNVWFPRSNAFESKDFAEFLSATMYISQTRPRPCRMPSMFMFWLLRIFLHWPVGTDAVRLTSVALPLCPLYSDCRERADRDCHTHIGPAYRGQQTGGKMRRKHPSPGWGAYLRTEHRYIYTYDGDVRPELATLCAIVTFYQCQYWLGLVLAHLIYSVQFQENPLCTKNDRQDKILLSSLEKFESNNKGRRARKGRRSKD